MEFGKITSTRRSNVTLLRRVDVSFGNDCFLFSVAEFWFLVKFWNFGQNWKFEILNPRSNPNFGILNPKPNFSILAKFGYLLNLILPNLDRSRRQLSNDTKIVKFGQNLVQKFWIWKMLISFWKKKTFLTAPRPRTSPQPFS